MGMKRGLTLIALMAWLAVPAAVEPQLSNFSIRGLVGTGDDVMIGGLMVGGTDPKKVLLRGRGPTLGDLMVSGAMRDPFLQLLSGQTVIAENDNWETTLVRCQSSVVNCGGAAEITATGLDPCEGNMTECSREAAILVTLVPGSYTMKLSGVGGDRGIGLVEVFEVGTSTSRLTNISARGVVGTEDKKMIGGFIIGGAEPKKVLIRGRGPVLINFGIPGVLANPYLQLYSGQTVIAQNDNWQAADLLCRFPVISCGRREEIIATGLDPCVRDMIGCRQESVILVTLPPGPYSVKLSEASRRIGKGLLEIFDVSN